MNIWCISKYAGVPKYGTAARLFFLAKEFKKMGHNAILITSDSNHFVKYPETKNRYNFEDIDGVPVHWIKTKKYKKTASISRIISWLDFEKWLFLFPKDRVEKPDVVIISSLSIFTIFYGCYLKKKYQSKLIFEIRDIWPLTMTEEGEFKSWHPLVILIGMIEKFGYKKSDLIVGTMPKLDIHVKKILGYDKPVFCSPLGFDPDKYNEDYLKDKNPFDELFPENKLLIGYAGSMGITNALESFIESIEYLKSNSKIHFMLVGSGDLRSEFEKQLSNCSNVTFLPRIEQNQVKYFLDKCDILYLSTKDSKVWEYGQSMNKIVEYMLSAKPIIASYTGYQSMINEAKCGQFVRTINFLDLQDVIIKFINMERSELVRLGLNGKEWIYNHRKYSTLSKEYIDRIYKLINE